MNFSISVCDARVDAAVAMYELGVRVEVINLIEFQSAWPHGQLRLSE
jgi:hypothetical protein